MPQATLDFQLSFPEARLLGNRTFGIGREPRRGLRKRSIERRSFDQQGNGFGQNLARDGRIGIFAKEDETGVIRWRWLTSIGLYGRICAGFKHFRRLEQRIYRRAQLPVLRGEA